MRWIRHHCNFDFLTRVTVASPEGRTQVILDITAVSCNGLITLLWRDALELSHDDLHGLAHDVSQSIESASVSHANDKSARTFLHGRVDAELEARDEGLATLEAESLHRVELAGHEGTPLVRPIESGVHVDALTLSWLSELDGLELLTDPVASLAILDMHELHTDLAAVSLLVSLDQISQLPFGLSLGDRAVVVGHVDREFTVHVSLCEAVVARVKQLEDVIFGESELPCETWAVSVVLLQLQGVDICDQVTVCHESSQHRVQTHHFI